MNLIISGFQETKLGVVYTVIQHNDVWKDGSWRVQTDVIKLPAIRVRGDDFQNPWEWEAFENFVEVYKENTALAYGLAILSRNRRMYGDNTSLLHKTHGSWSMFKILQRLAHDELYVLLMREKLLAPYIKVDDRVLIPIIKEIQEDHGRLIVTKVRTKKIKKEVYLTATGYLLTRNGTKIVESPLFKTDGQLNNHPYELIKKLDEFQHWLDIIAGLGTYVEKWVTPIKLMSLKAMGYDILSNPLTDKLMEYIGEFSYTNIKNNLHKLQGGANAEIYEYAIIKENGEAEGVGNIYIHED